MDEELRYFAHCLRIKVGLQTDFLGGALDGLAHCAETIRRWRNRGQETFGLELLADQWRLSKHLLGELPERAISHSPLDDFRGTAESQYLQLMLHSRLLDGAQARAQLALRSWALIRAHELATEGILGDAYLKQLCTSLRIATYEPIPDWGPVLSALVVKDQCFDMVAADMQAKESDIQGRMPAGTSLQDKHLAFLSAVNTMGNGGKRELKEEKGITSKAALAVPPPRRSAPGTVADASATEPLPATALYENRESDADVDTQIAYVDGHATPRQQEHEARSIYLTTALDASLVRWRWNTLSPYEAQALREKVFTALSDASSQPERRLLAALVWIALNAGRNLEETCRVSFDTGAQQFSQWRLNLEDGLIFRRAPRRQAHWIPRRDVAPLIHPPTNEIGWHLPPKVASVLRLAAAMTGRARYLRDLWTGTSSVPLDQAFLNWMQRDGLTARLRPGMLANTLKQETFERTGDALLARLLGSRDRDGLPAAGAYGTYLSTALPGAVRLTTALQGQAVNVAGSLLAPTTDDVLADGFRRAHAELVRVRSHGTWIEFHNLTALYWDAALRAATGVRPSNALWTDQELIDWTHAFVFVDEKASPLVRSGRLVPIPRNVLDAFRSGYVEGQLPRALAALREQGVHDLAAAGDLLFLIHTDEQGQMNCLPVTNKDREGQGIETPFPLNVFRHRLRTGLQRLGADPEVIDSVLGHSDGSSPTHGPYSMRIWSRDMVDLHPLLTKLFEALNVEEPPRPEFVPVDSPTHRPSRSNRALAGAPRRLKTARLAIAGALRTISAFLIEKLPLNNEAGVILRQEEIIDGLVRLTDVQVEQLENALTLTDKGMPSTTGALRHAYLVKLARRAWDVLEKPVRLRRRHRPTETEPSAFTVHAAGALDRMSCLRSELDKLFAARPHPSHVSLSDAQVMVTMDLIANSRIASPRVLIAPLYSRVNCRLASLGSDHYLEWSPDASLEERPEAPVQRFRIATRTAHLLEIVLAIRRRIDVDAHASSLLRTVRIALGLDEESHFEAAKDRAASLMAQCNAIELPGSVAGYLNGSLMTAALGQADFVRFRHQIFVRPPLRPEANEREEQPPLAVSRDNGPERHSDPSAAEGSARRMLRSVYKELDRLRAPEVSRHRQQGLKVLRESVSGAKEVSTTVRLLCLWAIDRLQKEEQERPLVKGALRKHAPDPSEEKPKRRKRIETVSALRYLTALKRLFIDLASDVDMLSLEAEELGDFYQTVLSEARVQNANYLYRRLKDFHRFAMRHGAAAVDWSELVPADAPDLGAPGFIDEMAYRQILEALETTTPPSGVQPWQLQVFVILCYRFGLRGGEVLHLLHGDWRTLPDGLPIVLVRPRRFHKLKSTAARRQVPLVFPLTKSEDAAIRQLEQHHEVAALGTSKPPLLGATNNPQKPIGDAVVRQHLNRVIQAVTGQQGLSLHDMRHSLACRVWQALELPLMPAGSADNGLDVSELAHLRETLLGPNSPRNTRRGAWVLASLLAHASSATTMRSYVHFVAEVADALVAPLVDGVPAWSKRPPGPGNDLLQLLDLVPERVDGALLVDPPLDLTPALAFDALVHFAHGTSCAETAALLRVSIESAERLLKLANELHDRLGSTSKRLPKTARVAPQGLLSRIPVSSFQRLRIGLASFRLNDLHPDAAPGLADQHVLGMVGPSREVSMWTRAQMSLVARLVRSSVANRRRLVLCGSSNVKASLVAGAIDSGWLATQWTGTGLTSALCTRLNKKTLPPPAVVAPMDTRIANRLVLELMMARDGWIHDRVELWISVICLHSCTPASPNSPLFDADIG